MQTSTEARHALSAEPAKHFLGSVPATSKPITTRKTKSGPSIVCLPPLGSAALLLTSKRLLLFRKYYTRHHFLLSSSLLFVSIWGEDVRWEMQRVRITSSMAMCVLVSMPRLNWWDGGGRGP